MKTNAVLMWSARIPAAAAALALLVPAAAHAQASMDELAADRDQSTAGLKKENSANYENSPIDGTANEYADMDLDELFDVEVVTASRHATKLASVPFAVTVITADDIRATGVRSIPDALRLAPGVDVADLSFANAAVSTRGFHGLLANQVLVLVDGRQIFDSVFGGTLWGVWPFQIEDIDRIEVIRGPGGVVWGANAVNGVINIITKDPADQLGLTITLGGGSRGSFKQHIGYGAKDGKLRYRFSGEYEASDGFRKGGSLFRSFEDEYKGGRFSLHAVYDMDEDNTLTFSAGSAVVDDGFPSTPLAGFGLRSNASHRTSFVLFNWDRRNGTADHTAFTAFVNEFSGSPGIPQIDWRYQQIGLQFGHTYRTDDAHARTWGVDSRVDLLDAGNSDPHMLSKDFISTAIVGLYLNDDWKFAPRWTLNLGGRIDYEFYGGFQPSARASLSYELSDEAVLFGAVSRAFHMPTAAGRFLDIPLVNGLVTVTSNGDVDPVTLIAYEIGYRGDLFDRVKTSLSLFWHDYDEVATLSPQLGPPGLIQNRFENRSGNVSLYGAELETHYKVTEKFTLVGNYTYQQLNWDVNKPFTDRDYITPPKHKAMVGARFAVSDDLRLSSNLFFVDAVKAPNPANPFRPRRVDPYLRLDLTAEYEFLKDRAALTVGVKNLLDPNHYEGGSLFLNDGEVPRMVFAEIRIQIR